MHKFVLFSLLTSLALAAPHKRACNRPAPSDGDEDTVQPADPAVTSSLKAVAAWGQWRTRTRTRHRPSTTSFVPPSTSANVQPTGTPGVGDQEPPIIAPILSSSSISISSSSPRPSTSSTGPGGTTPNPVPRSNGAGLAINTESVNSFSGFLQGGLSWYTGWSANPLKGTEGLEFVPQIWGEQNVAGAADSAKSWTGVKYVLSFNEPDMKSDVGGSDMTPQLAATKHKEWTKAIGSSFEIGAPAVARGSTKWMEDWITACDGGCEYSFVPFHYYGTDANDLIKYAQDFHAKFNKPLWVTEWSCKDYSNGYTCNEEEIKAFMKTAIDWFKGDGADIVHRWAYFGAFPKMASAEGDPNGLENADGSINELGKYYINL